MRWVVSHRFDRRGASMADRHYSRGKIGSPQFVAPGRNLVLLTPDASALWVTVIHDAETTKHAWPGAWECSMFRNEGPDLSSELILEAVAATRWKYGEPPAVGMITFVDAARTRHKRDPGRCFVRAGFRRLTERTKKRGLVVLQMTPDAMPEPREPLGAQRRLVVA